MFKGGNDDALVLGGEDWARCGGGCWRVCWRHYGRHCFVVYPSSGTENPLFRLLFAHARMYVSMLSVSLNSPLSANWYGEALEF